MAARQSEFDELVFSETTWNIISEENWLVIHVISDIVLRNNNISGLLDIPSLSYHSLVLTTPPNNSVAEQQKPIHVNKLVHCYWPNSEIS